MSEIDEFVKKYGKDGVRLLILYKYLKHRIMQKPNLKSGEKTIDQSCLEISYKLARALERRTRKTRLFQ